MAVFPLAQSFYFAFIAALFLLFYLRQKRLKAEFPSRVLLGWALFEITCYAWFVVFAMKTVAPTPTHVARQTFLAVNHTKPFAFENMRIRFKDIPRDEAAIFDQSPYQINPSALQKDVCELNRKVDWVTNSVHDLVLARLGRMPGESASYSYPSYPDRKKIDQDKSLKKMLGCDGPKAIATSHVIVSRSLEDEFKKVRFWNENQPVILSSSASKERISSHNGVSTVTVENFEPDKIDFLVTTSKNWFIYLDSFHAGWKVTVNGQPSEIYRANLAFKAVPLTQSQNRIRFEFLGNGTNPIRMLIFLWMGFMTALAGLFLIIRDIAISRPR